MAIDRINLYGHLVMTGNIETITGLHIGGSGGAFSIGGVDKPVILNPLTGQPYIPGSSLRGKMRSLTEKYMGLPLRSMGSVRIHQPNHEADYRESPVAQIYGIPAEDFSLPTRLIVRDVPLHTDSAEQLRRARTELPYTEVKTEVSIDRITSQANPRQFERVPAGAVFGPMELIYSIYEWEDLDRFSLLIDGMALLEDDYLGGQGSRGYGKVIFRDLQIALKFGKEYRDQATWGTPYATLSDLSADWNALLDDLQTQMRPIIGT